VSDVVAVARYLTVLPIPGRADGGLERVGRGAAWFPMIGLVLGALLLIVDWITARLFPPLLSALLVVTVWKLLSGGLHLDGLADCFDGLVGRDPTHRLVIMRDSRIGAFGAMGLILFLFLEIAALAELTATRVGTLFVAPAIGRAMPPLLARLYAPARPEGHGAAFRAGVGRIAPGIALAIALAASVVVLGWLGIVALAAAAIVAVAFGRFMVARLGGITGDVLGASIEISEIVVLLTVSAWIHALLA
jgi:adenosylcobinamide-GDP ribazoletransferase